MQEGVALKVAPRTLGPLGGMLVPSPINVTILDLRCFNRLVSYLPHTANAQRTRWRDLRVGTFSGKGRRRRGKGTVLAPRRDGKSSPFLGGGGGDWCSALTS